jgi:hypothetical protein
MVPAADQPDQRAEREQDVRGIERLIKREDRIDEWAIRAGTMRRGRKGARRIIVI